MKKIVLILSILILGGALSSAVYANYYDKGFYRICINDIEKAKKFQQETLPLRDEMISKKLEIRKEYQKETPDIDKIAQLKKDIIDIKTKIHRVAKDIGIDFGKCFNKTLDKHCGCYNKWRFGHKQRGDW